MDGVLAGFELRQLFPERLKRRPGGEEVEMSFMGRVREQDPPFFEDRISPLDRLRCCASCGAAAMYSSTVRGFDFGMGDLHSLS
jgi:hypothetical protein